MARYTKQSVTSLAGINSELTKIQTALTDTLSRKGDTPNQMEGTFDANNNRIINLPDPVEDHEPVTVSSVQKYVDAATGANIVSETQPTSGLRQGLRWYKPSDAVTYVYYIDEDGGQWIEEPVQSAEGTLRTELADVASTVLIGGQQAQTVGQLVQQVNARTKNGIVYGDDGRRYRVISAVIRNSGAGWFIINDPVHEPTGLQSVSVEPDGTIRLNHNVGAVEVGTLVATPDETFAKQGLIIGGSIGTSISFLQITAPLQFIVNTASGVLTKDAIFGSDITASVSAGQCTINHTALTAATGVATASTVGSAVKTDFNLSTGATQVVIDAVGDADGYIRWDGANWLYSGQMRNPPTMVFSGGELTVTHDSASQFNLSLVGREDGLRVGAGAIDKTSFKVRFYDAAGAQVTTVSTLMKFYFTRQAKVNKTDLSGSIAVRRGYVPVNANNVVSATGNIWIYGLMVV